MLYKNTYELVGNTPLIELSHIKEEYHLPFNLYAKVEYFNPAGSVKDRIALKMITDAENKGLIKKGSVIIEPTSGNTGIGLASIGAMKGYKVVLTMPSSMSEERKRILKAYGAELILTDPKLGMKGSIDKANELNKEIPNSIILGQFTNPVNPLMHYETTGPEIYKDLEGHVDVFIAGIGTGGTISGIGRYLKEQNKDIKVIGVEPASSPLITEGHAGPHGLQGIGANFIPDILDRSIIDEMITIKEDEAYELGRMMGKKEGMLIGITSGAALAAAIKLKDKAEYKNKNVVVLLPDTGDRYLSTPMFE